MHIQLLSPAFPPEITGSGTLYHDLARDLVAAGHRVTLIVAQPRQRLGEQQLPEQYGKRWILEEKIDGIEVIRPATVPVPLTNPIAKGLDHFLVALVYALAGLKAERADVVMAYSPPLPLGAAAWLLARRARAPFVLNAQDMFPQYAVDVGLLRSRLLIGFFRWLERFLYRRAACITVHSEGNRRYLMQHRGVPGAKVRTIYNWTDTENFRTDAHGPDVRSEFGFGDRFVVLYAGTLGWAQGLDVVVDAAERLASDPGILFVIAGDGPRRNALVERVKAAGLGNVQFLPLQPPVKYAAMMRASNVAVISLNPRITTPVVPGKLCDILAAGVPVVASVPLGGDAAQIVTASRAGICVAADRGDALAEAIRTLKADPAQAATLGANGRQYASTFFSREARTAEYEAVLVQLASASRKPSRWIAEVPPDDALGPPGVRRS